MNILIVKLSSFGDLIHTFPAITDLKTHVPEARIDWLVDASYAAIPSWHPGVDNVLELPMRKQGGKRNWRAMFKAHQKLREKQYDVVIDVQGLMKSSFCLWGLKGVKHGFATSMLRESLARLSYHHQHEVDAEHIIEKNRQLLAAALDYSLEKTYRFGIESQAVKRKQLVFFMGSSWHNKRWPLSHWYQLVRKAIDQGYHVVMPWGSQQEKNELLSFNSFPSSQLTLSSYSLDELKEVLALSEVVIASDTGILHLAQALDTKVIGLFGPTDPKHSGSKHWVQSKEPCVPCRQRKCKFRDNYWSTCMNAIHPEDVWSSLIKII
ncbi:MAG TPA: lipopolysaccharide heptosyltransferase I [Gammaproteobacteria bacterium]|nr:lipopolysaccharide heptosyltransferase I [Gammaproteobacteria bacterium]